MGKIMHEYEHKCEKCSPNFHMKSIFYTNKMSDLGILHTSVYIFKIMAASSVPRPFFLFESVNYFIAFMKDAHV